MAETHSAGKQDRACRGSDDCGRRELPPPSYFGPYGFKLFVGAVSQRESLLKVYFKLNRCGSRVDNSQHVPTSKRTRIDQRERARSSPVNGDDN